VSGEERGGEEDGIKEIEEPEIRGGNVMHERQSEERQQQQQQQHMWSPPSQRSAVGNPVDQKVFTEVAYLETPVALVGNTTVEARMLRGFRGTGIWFEVSVGSGGCVSTSTCCTVEAVF